MTTEVQAQRLCPSTQPPNIKRRAQYFSWFGKRQGAGLSGTRRRAFLARDHLALAADGRPGRSGLNFNTHLDCQWARSSSSAMLDLGPVIPSDAGQGRRSLTLGATGRSALAAVNQLTHQAAPEGYSL